MGNQKMSTRQSAKTDKLRLAPNCKGPFRPHVTVYRKKNTKSHVLVLTFRKTTCEVDIFQTVGNVCWSAFPIFFFTVWAYKKTSPNFPFLCNHLLLECCAVYLIIMAVSCVLRFRSRAEQSSAPENPYIIFIKTRWQNVYNGYENKMIMWKFMA